MGWYGIFESSRNFFAFWLKGHHVLLKTYKDKYVSSWFIVWRHNNTRATQQHTTTRLSAIVFLTSWITPCFIKDMIYWKYTESKSKQAHGDGVYIPKVWHALGGWMVSFALANRCMIADQSFHCSRSGWLSPSPMACMIRNIYRRKVAMYAASITNRSLLKVYPLCRGKGGLIAWMGFVWQWWL